MSLKSLCRSWLPWAVSWQWSLEEWCLIYHSTGRSSRSKPHRYYCTVTSETLICVTIEYWIYGLNVFSGLLPSCLPGVIVGKHPPYYLLVWQALWNPSSCSGFREFQLVILLMCKQFFLQSVLMNLAMFALIHLCVSINNKVSVSFYSAHFYQALAEYCCLLWVKALKFCIRINFKI